MQSDYSEMLGFLEQSEIEIWVSTPSFADMCLADRNFCGGKDQSLKTFLILRGSAYYSYGREVKGTFPGGSYHQYLSSDRIYGGSHRCDYNREVIAGDHCPGKFLPVGHEKPGTYIEIWDKAGKVLPEG